MTFADQRLAKLGGFRVEIDPQRERADVVLDRPRFNIIEMLQRDQLRLVFEAIDEDPRVRVIVLRAVGEHFSSGGNIKGFLEASPEDVSKLAWNVAAPARCAKPVIVANRGYCFGVGFEISCLRFPARVGDLPLRPAGAAPRANPWIGRIRPLAKDRRHHSHQGHRDALQAHSRQACARVGHRH
jgi:Enoyl-CoA hydratase/isomerase